MKSPKGLGRFDENSFFTISFTNKEVLVNCPN